jgi:hypothetical protein
VSAFNISSDVALHLIRHHLSGFRGYPRDVRGEEVFARCLQECCCSVSHAESVLVGFGGEFPTKNQIIQGANDVRERFEPTAETRAEWERKYGPAAPIKVDPADFRPKSDQEMWAQLKRHFTDKEKGFPGWSKISWVRIYEAQEALGYPLNSAQLQMIGKG